MGAAVSITRLELTAAQLRAAAGREKDGMLPDRAAISNLAIILQKMDLMFLVECCAFGLFKGNTMGYLVLFFAVAAICLWPALTLSSLF